jgi:hypothetical protein
VRLEAMEGVVAFHVGDRPAAARSLRAAQERYDRLQVGRRGGDAPRAHGTASLTPRRRTAGAAVSWVLHP